MRINANVILETVAGHRLKWSPYLFLSSSPNEMKIAVPSEQGHSDLSKVLVEENRNERAEPWLGLPGAYLIYSDVSVRIK